MGSSIADQVSLSIGLLVLVVIPIFTMQQRIRRVERMLLAVMDHLGLDAASYPKPSALVRDLASDPTRKLAAIKAYRQQTGLGLAEANAAIEKLISTHSNV